MARLNKSRLRFYTSDLVSVMTDSCDPRVLKHANALLASTLDERLGNIGGIQLPIQGNPQTAKYPAGVHDGIALGNEGPVHHLDLDTQDLRQGGAAL